MNWAKAILGVVIGVALIVLFATIFGNPHLVVVGAES